MATPPPSADSLPMPVGCRLPSRRRPAGVFLAGRPPSSPRLGITSLMKPGLPHCIEAELISALGMGTNLDVAAADQSRPSATRTARPIHPMRCIFIPHLGKIGLAYFSPSECEVAHASRGINGGSNQRACSHGQESDVPLRPACEPALTCRSPAARGSAISAIL